MILNINKPKGLTSHDIVNQVRKITGKHKVGHGGTLDPLATGVLIVGVGRESTKQLEEILKGTDKEYEALIELGKTSSTDDSEGDISIVKKNLSEIDAIKIKNVLLEFKGEIMQIPPAFSAIKIGGIPAYKLARQGKKTKLKPRSVEIKKIELTNFNLPYIQIQVRVSSGTYIRSLVRDVGKKLGTGGYLKELVRTKVGKFSINEALTLEQLYKKTQMSNNAKNSET